jgi:plasmid stabilization system protein ParE
MAYKITWSARSRKRFNEISEYLENEYGEFSRKRFVTKLDDFIEILTEYQNFGTTENNEVNIRKYVLVKQISIIFRVKKNEIIILNLYDNRQNPTNRKY